MTTGVLNPSTLGFNYHVHPGGFFDPPTHQDGNGVHSYILIYKLQWFDLSLAILFLKPRKCSFIYASFLVSAGLTFSLLSRVDFKWLFY